MTPFRDDLWNLPAWAYPIHWTLVIVCGALVVYGGGGACMWLEHKPGQRINDLRMDEVAAVGADLAALACPFCLIMLEEAATAQASQSSLQLKDIAEVVATALDQTEQGPQRLHRPIDLFDRGST